MGKRPLYISNRTQKGIIIWVKEHWQFLLTFIIAAAGTWLLVSQNNLLKNQNTLIEQQMSLEEASRRSALVMLMSNIMDKVDREIESQQKGLSEKQKEERKYKLSQSLIGQIAALSHSFKPYRYMDGDTLIDRPLSPERGQLLITLILLPLDNYIFHRIYSSSNFESADLQNIDFHNVNLGFAKLNHANLRGAKLFHANMAEAELSHANLDEANLRMAYLAGANLDYSSLNGTILSSADLHGVKMRNANLYNVKLWNATIIGVNLSNSNLIRVDLSRANLKSTDLRNASSLYQTIGIPDSLKTIIAKESPKLFVNPLLKNNNN